MLIDPATFRCRQCGACCRVPGYVALESRETEAIADFLGLDVYAFTEAYTHLTWNRRDLSLIEREDGGCIFLEPDNSCRIQPVKPKQCRGFPSLWHTPALVKTCAGLSPGRRPEI
ncbi:MAG TPA: YkgJ family cysteine cluster protein [Kiritimatiellia bacterium]|nr:YkgJ family cysteine cluster protein [Kiritimatiellia bacterium]HRU69626.1 YkgJ family cysteine cluster protein [Kiritimatiellia bacterium]